MQTRLRYSSGVFFDGYDIPKERERGTGDILDQLGAELKRQVGKPTATSKAKRK